MTELAKRIRRLMFDKDMNNNELAYAAKITVTGLSLILNRKRVPRPGTLNKLAIALGVPLEELEAESAKLIRPGDTDKERILCAAIWYRDGILHHAHQPKNISEGFVICGRQHHNVIATYAVLTGQPTRRETSVQGFVTTRDMFLNRQEANMVAIAAGQVFGNTPGDELISEDLY